MSTLASNDAGESLHNYDMHEEIGRGGTSTVYLATCRRGRMRNRLVAVKKIPLARDTSSTSLATSAALHQSLCHPSIASLLSVFTAGITQYHVLEICINGTLQDFLLYRNPAVVDENELRGVVKCLVDVLIYLRKERVIHHDLKPSNVLLNEAFRVKLSDFGLAVRLPSETSTVSNFCGSPNYVSPEIVARKPHGLTTDLWSLGCLMVTCLTAKPAFNASSIQETFDNISSASYDLPPNVSREARELVSSLLQINPRRRISLDQIIFHPFLDASLPVQPLTSKPTNCPSLPHQASHSRAIDSKHPPLKKVPQGSFRTVSCHLSSPTQPDLVDKKFRAPTSRAETQFHSIREDNHQFNTNDSGLAKLVRPLARIPLANIGNLDNSNAPSVRDWKTPSSGAPPFGSIRRVFSAPQSRAPSAPSLTERRLQTVAADSERETEPDFTSLPRGKHLKLLALAHQSRTASAPLDQLYTRLVSGAISGSGSVPDSGMPALSSFDSVSSGDVQHNSLWDHGSESEESARPVLLPTATSKGKLDGPRHAQRMPETDIHDSNLGEDLRPREKLALEHPPKRLQNQGIGVQVLQHGHGTQHLAPIGTTRPVPLNTTYLSPQTHKVVKGQLTILPSRSLLVDFREGERRKGRKGNQVLVISPDGIEVKAYSAPHLSTPCCLAEPLAIYSLEELPQSYWKIYNDASRMVDEMKQRVPKLIFYRPDAQCTLMANEPSGDIEVVIPPHGSIVRQPRGSSLSNAATPDSPVRMRLRLIRQRRAVEISRYTPSLAHEKNAKSSVENAGEWIKKILPIFGYPFRVDHQEWCTLQACEQAGLSILWYFVRVCETVEKVPAGDPDDPCKPGVSDDGAALNDSVHTVKPPSSSPKNTPRNTVGGHKELRRTSTSTLVSPSTTTERWSTPTARQSYKLAPDVSSQESRTCSGSRSIFTAATAATMTLPSVFVAPRPAKFASAGISTRCSASGDSGALSCHSAAGGDTASLSLPGVTRLLQSDGTSVEIGPADKRGRFDRSINHETTALSEVLDAVKSTFSDIENVGSFEESEPC